MRTVIRALGLGLTILGLTIPALPQERNTPAANSAHQPGERAPEKDDPGARIAAEVSDHGTPTPEYKRQLQQLRIQKSVDAQGLVSARGKGIAAQAPITPGLPVWIPIGPDSAHYLQNFFTIHAVDSGRIRTILPDPANADNLYVLTSGGGLWSTNNFTNTQPTWTVLTDGISTTGGGSVAFGRTTNVLYLGTGDPFDVINTGGSVLTSTDGGAHWSNPVDLGNAMSVRDIKVDTSAAQDIVLAATDVGLYRSIDGGTSFTQAPLGGAINSTTAVWSIVRTSAGWLANAQSCPRVPAIACGSASTIYLSTDQGATWNPISTTSGFPTVTAGRTTLGVAVPGDAVVYAFAENAASTDQLDLFRSADGGQTWTALNINAKTAVNANGDNPNMDLMHGQAFYNQMLLVDSRDPNRNTVYLGGNLSSAVSANGGQSWTLLTNWLAQFNLPYVHADMHAAALITAGTTPIVVFGTDGGIFASIDNGANWDSNKNTGLETFLVYSLYSTPKFPASVIAGTQDNGTRVREGASTTFNMTVGGDGLGTGWSQTNPAISMGTIEFSELFPNLTGQTPDIAEDWDFFPLPVGSSDTTFFTAVGTPTAAADPTGQVFYSYSLSRVFKSVNGGVTWNAIGTIGGNVPITTPATNFRDTVHGIAISPLDLQHIAVARNSGHLALTTNGGTTWTDSSIGASVTGFANISSILWADNSTLYVTSDNPNIGQVRVVKSVNGGLTWTRADFGLPDVQANRIIADPNDSTHKTLLAGTDLGVFQTTDGEDWLPYGTGLPNVRVNDVYMPQDGSFVRIATYGRGIWELPGLELVSASLTDDVTSCDHDGSLDNGETGHLKITLHNNSSTPLSGVIVTALTNNPAVGSPSSFSASFPTIPAGSDATGSVTVTLNGAIGIQQIEFNVFMFDTAFNLLGPAAQSVFVRANTDEIPNSSTSDDFEATVSPWTVTGATENLPDVVEWHRQEISPLDHRWLGIASPSVTDMALVSPPLTLGSTPPFSFTFSHRYVFENNSPNFFDGGVVEISQDNGATWTDITAIPGATLSPAYPHVVAVGPNALSGRPAFTGVSAGYPALQLETATLPSTMAGASIQVRFRIGTDTFGGTSGWMIDNFAFTGLANEPFSSVVADRGSCAAAATSTALISSLNPSNAGDSVTFTATVSGATTPTGNVAFLDGTTTLSTVALSVGQAAFTTSSLSVGSHSITASYAGDGTHNASVSPAVNQVVNAIPTTTTLISDTNPATLGQTVTFTATVAGGATPTGSVAFKDGITSLSTVSLVSGQATFSTAALAPGTHSITAVYGGDATHASSTSAVVNQVVNGTPTTTTVTSDTNPSIFGQTVQFTITVAGGATPTGTATLFDGATLFGGVTLTNGQGPVATSTLSTGTHNITAVYSGDATHDPSTSAVLVQVVNPISTTTTLSFNTPAAFAQQVSLVATVTPANSAGNVTFTDGTTTLGSVPVSGGTAVLLTSTLAVGQHSITASFGGSTNFTASASTPQPLTVIQAGSTTTLAATTSTVFGSTVTFHATVVPAVATGTVTFKDGTTSLGSSPLASGSASFSILTLAAGSHSITASYSGDANVSPSTSAPQTQVITQASTTTSLISSANPAATGASVTFTATVSSFNGTPAGSVSFNDGTTTLGSSALNASGVATFTTSNLAAGTHSISAVFAGSTNFIGSTSLTLNENIATPDYKLVSDKNSVTLRAGQSATITITGQSVGGYSGTVSFTCGNLPQLTTCTFAPSTLTLNSNGTAASSILTIKTSGPNAGLVNPFNGIGGRGMFALACLMPVGMGLVVLALPGNKRTKQSWIGLMMLVVLVGMFSGCGGGSAATPPPPPPPTTPAGTTAFSVSTTATTSTGSPNPANPSQQLNLSITVQP